jgi:hypothetical protein
MDRILVAASVDGYHRLRAALRDVEADYVTSWAGGVEALLRGQYSQVVVDLLFAESRMLKFARFVKEQQPSAHLACLNVTGYPLNEAASSEIEERLRRLGCDGVIDLRRGWKDQERRLARRDRRVYPRSLGLDDRRRAPPLTL